MQIIPAIDLRNGRCVRLTRGEKNNQTVYDVSPVEVAQNFADAGAQILHVVDLDAAFSETNTRNREVLRDLISVVGMPIQFGGGLRSIDEVERVLDLGVSRVVIGTVAAESPETLERMIEQFGTKSIAVGIDARNGIVMTRGWEKDGSISALDLANKLIAFGIERVIYTDIQRDGTLTGPNIEETATMAKTGLKITASGGISSLQDIRALSHRAIDSAIVGKALHEGLFSLQEAISCG